MILADARSMNAIPQSQDTRVGRPSYFRKGSLSDKPITIRQRHESCVILHAVYPHLAGCIVKVQSHIIGIAAKIIRQVTFIIREGGIDI